MQTRKSLKPLIVVPYRDRPTHLEEFIPAMKAYMPCDIAVVEQGDGKAFNRGKLLNAGFLLSPNYPVYIFHDVDMIPLEVDYAPTAPIIQLASSPVQTKDYLGGVTLFQKAAFLTAGGYSNKFFSRAEDNEMMFNLRRKSLTFALRPGTYRDIWHPRPLLEFDPVLWKKAQYPRINDGLPHCEYRLMAVENKEFYKHFVVEL